MFINIKVNKQGIAFLKMEQIKNYTNINDVAKQKCFCMCSPFSGAQSHRTSFAKRLCNNCTVIIKVHHTECLKSFTQF